MALVAAFAGTGLFAAPAQAVALASFTTTSTLAKCDDCSAQVPIGFSVKFGSSNFSSAWVNNNGNISFEYSLALWFSGAFGNGSFPTAIGSAPPSVIAPFFGDVDTTSLGTVSVGSGTYNGAQAFAVTWSNVGGFQVAGQDSFQMILTNRASTGVGNFDIYFNYESIAWSATSASGTVYARQGMQSADGKVAYNSPYSGTPQQVGVPTQTVTNNAALITDTNDGVAGQRYFQIRNGVISTVSPVPEPATWALMLGGFGLIGGVARHRRRSTAARA